MKQQKKSWKKPKQENQEKNNKKTSNKHNDIKVDCPLMNES
jgi:hypothetical protein